MNLIFFFNLEKYANNYVANVKKTNKYTLYRTYKSM